MNAPKSPAKYITGLSLSRPGISGIPFLNMNPATTAAIKGSVRSTPTTLALRTDISMSWRSKPCARSFFSFSSKAAWRLISASVRTCPSLFFTGSVFLPEAFSSAALSCSSISWFLSSLINTKLLLGVPYTPSE